MPFWIFLQCQHLIHPTHRTVLVTVESHLTFPLLTAESLRQIDIHTHFRNNTYQVIKCSLYSLYLSYFIFTSYCHSISILKREAVYMYTHTHTCIMYKLIIMYKCKRMGDDVSLVKKSFPLFNCFEMQHQAQTGAFRLYISHCLFSWLVPVFWLPSHTLYSYNIHITYSN